MPRGLQHIERFEHPPIHTSNVLGDCLHRTRSMRTDKRTSISAVRRDIEQAYHERHTLTWPDVDETQTKTCNMKVEQGVAPPDKIAFHLGLKHTRQLMGASELILLDRRYDFAYDVQSALMGVSGWLDDWALQLPAPAGSLPSASYSAECSAISIRPQSRTRQPSSLTTPIDTPSQLPCSTKPCEMQFVWQNGRRHFDCRTLTSFVPASDDGTIPSRFDDHQEITSSEYDDKGALVSSEKKSRWVRIERSRYTFRLTFMFQIAYDGHHHKCNEYTQDMDVVQEEAEESAEEVEGSTEEVIELGKDAEDETDVDKLPEEAGKPKDGGRKPEGNHGNTSDFTQFWKVDYDAHEIMRTVRGWQG